MKDRELEDLIDGGESDRVEFKPSLAEFDKIVRTLCAFANDLPGHGKSGVLIVGLEDDGDCAELEISEIWFRDRIEIHNPGGLFGQVTRETLGQPHAVDYRNPHLAEVMKNLGYVQKFGVGIAVARRELAANGNPPPEFEPSDNSFLVIVRRRPS